MTAGPTVGCMVFFGCYTGYVGVTALGGKGGVEDKTVVTEDVGTCALLLLVKSGEISSEASKGQIRY